jgi:hypothetical protein
LMVGEGLNFGGMRCDPGHSSSAGYGVRC